MQLLTRPQHAHARARPAAATAALTRRRPPAQRLCAASADANPAPTSAPTTSTRIIAIAVDQSRASRHAVRWACEHLWRGDDSKDELRLLHVVPSVSSTSAFALGGLAAGVAAAPLDSAASLDGSDEDPAVDLAAAEAMAAAAAGTVVTTATTASGGQQHHSSFEQQALARRAERALAASLVPLARRRGCARCRVEVVRGRAGASVAEELARAAEESGAVMLVLASARRGGNGGGVAGPGGSGGFDDGRAKGSNSNSGNGGWLGQVLGGVPSLLFRPPVSAEVVRRCKVPTVLLSGPE